MDNEQDIVNFCDITGTSTDVAKNFLQIADNNVEMAISLYLESGGDLGTGSAPAAQSSRNTSRPSSIHSNDNMLTDEEIARQMQESEELSQRRRRQQQQEDEVRAPIAPRNDILAGGSINDMIFHPSPISSRWQRDTISTSRPSVFNQGDSTTGSVSDFLNRLDAPSRSLSGSPSADSLNSPGTSTPTAVSKAKRLADLFRPPFDIMFRGNFEEAREDAKEKNKWLMINVQNPTEFQCQVMNRDLWSDSFVKDIIRESFIFLQYLNDTADGKRYATFYSVSGYPHLAIIDARTGERVKVWEKPITPTEFMMDITEFLEQNAGDNIHSRSNQKRPRKTKDLSDMSEEEQLNAAIAASLNAASAKSASQSPTDHMDTDIPASSSRTKGKQKESIVIDDEEEDEDAKFEPKKDEEEEEEIKAGSALDGIKAIKRDETKDMQNSTRVQLRMGDGSRIVRRFLKSDPVRYLFEFVKSEVPNADSQSFELVFNRTQLIDLLDQTILDAGLSNAAVNCVFV